MAGAWPGTGPLKIKVGIYLVPFQNVALNDLSEIRCNRMPWVVIFFYIQIFYKYFHLGI